MLSDELKKLTGLNEFMPGVCCDHDWLYASDEEGQNPMNHDEICSKCGATCRRKNGSIVEYSRPVPGMKKGEEEDVQI